MNKKVVTILVVIAVLLALGIAGMLGYVWYRDNHIFVQGTAYPLDAAEIDLTGVELTIAEYEAIQAQVPGTKIYWNVPFQGGFHSNRSEKLTVQTVTRKDLDQLHLYFPELKELDAIECRDYGLLADFAREKPECQVRYEVDLGGRSFAPDVTSLVLETGEYTLELLTENLPHLPGVTEILLRKPELSAEEVEELKGAFEQVTFLVTVEILGTEYETTATEVDLTALTAEDVADVAQKLIWLPGVTQITLDSSIAKTDVKAMMEAAPQIVFDYSFDFFGTTLSTAQEEVVLKNVKIGDENEQEIREALDILNNCSRFVLDNCKMSDEVMAKIREDYRGRTKVVWRVWFGKGSTLTDAEVIRAVYDLVDDNCHDLVYCEDAVFVDFGHNEWLDGCDFISGMVNLEYCIISGSPIKDLTPFASCKKLKFLELAFCDYLTDATPLAQCESLEMLNISNTHIVDLSPLDNLPLTHLVARMWITSGTTSRVSVEEQERFMAVQPDCQSYFSDKKNPYGEGWRYAEDNKSYLPYYAKIREVMRYDQDPNIPNHVGWYLDQ